MKYPDNFSNLLFVIEDLSASILNKIEDYEKNIHNNPFLKKDFHNIDFVYMHSVLLDMGKLLAVTKSDRSGLTELENLSPKDFKKRIQGLRGKYSDVFDKVTSNRNKIIAHVDISDMGSYFNLGFSEIEINKKVADFEKYLKSTRQEKTDGNLKIITDLEALKSKSIKYERYSPSDFFESKETFKAIVTEVLSIARDLNYYFYNLK